MTWEDFKTIASDKIGALSFKAVDAFGGSAIDKAASENTNSQTVTGQNNENTPVGEGRGSAFPSSIPSVVWIVGGVVLLGGVVYLATKKR